jgi:hypothetical protein
MTERNANTASFVADWNEWLRCGERTKPNPGEECGSFTSTLSGVLEEMTLLRQLVIKYPRSMYHITLRQSLRSIREAASRDSQLVGMP